MQLETAHRALAFRSLICSSARCDRPAKVPGFAPLRSVRAMTVLVATWFIERPSAVLRNFGSREKTLGVPLQLKVDVMR
jgi:hypothetical protein